MRWFGMGALAITSPAHLRPAGPMETRVATVSKTDISWALNEFDFALSSNTSDNSIGANLEDFGREQASS
jgi:hypothetical protein